MIFSCYLACKMILMIFKQTTRQAFAPRFYWLITIAVLSLAVAQSSLASNKNNLHNQNSYICEDNENMGETPIYIFKLKVCNYDQLNPVDVYAIRMSPEPSSGHRYCLKGKQQVDCSPETI